MNKNDGESQRVIFKSVAIVNNEFTELLISFWNTNGKDLQKQLRVGPVCIFTCVGVMVFTSSEARLLSSVVFPALSSPRSTILTSCSVDPFSFSMTESKPCREEAKAARSYICRTHHWKKKYHDRSFVIGYFNYTVFVEGQNTKCEFNSIREKTAHYLLFPEAEGLHHIWRKIKMKSFKTDDV